MSARLLLLALWLTQFVCAQGTLSTAPDNSYVFDVTVGSSTIKASMCSLSLCSPTGGGAASVGIFGLAPGPANLKFKYTGVTSGNTARPTAPNFVVVFPSSGETPASVLIGVNQGVVRSMGPGDYFLRVNFSTVDQIPPSQAGFLVVLRLSPPPPPTVTSVVSAASLLPVISPGAIVSIFGSTFGSTVGPTTYDDTALYPTTVPGGTPSFGNTTVTFNGAPAPLLYVSQSQINAVVPYALSGQKAASVVVNGYTGPAFTVPIFDTSPGIFTATQNGSGQGAILNAGIGFNTFTYNSADNPVAKGGVISLFATGTGAFDPPVPDGAISLAVGALSVAPAPLLCGYIPSCRRPVGPISLTIGGKSATIIYTGPSPYQPWSVLQVNAVVPSDVDSGNQPIVLTVGQNDNTQQKVTVAVR
jgi:uncharacterized protein (TIGR03437 family)